MKKRGQVAVFIILGVVVMILLSFVYYVRVSLAKQEVAGSIKKTTKTAVDVASIEKYAENCLREVSDRGLWLAGEHGGYIDPDGNEAYGEEAVSSSLLTNYLGKKVPYYLDLESSNPPPVPSLENMEKNLSRYVIVEFERCLDLTNFEGSGFYIIRPSINYTKINFNFDITPIKSKVSINEDSVIVEIEYPLTIKRKDSEAELKNFRVNLPVRLGRLYTAIVNTAYPEGVLKNITDEWDGGGIYDITLLDCDNYDKELKQINIYSRNSDDGDTKTKIIRIVDYNPFYYAYFRAYVFQFAIKKYPIDFAANNVCGGH